MLFIRLSCSEDLVSVVAEDLSYAAQTVLAVKLNGGGPKIGVKLQLLHRLNGAAAFRLSAAANQGAKELVYHVWNQLEKLPPVEVFEPEMSLDEPAPVEERDIQITRGDDAVFYVTGAWVEKIVGSVNFDEYESRMYFERTLRKAGVFDMLEARGIKEKDTVDVLGIQFEYVY